MILHYWGVKPSTGLTCWEPWPEGTNVFLEWVTGGHVDDSISFVVDTFLDCLGTPRGIPELFWEVPLNERQIHLIP